MTDIHSCHPWCKRPLCVAMREAMGEEREARMDVSDVLATWIEFSKTPLVREYMRKHEEKK